MAHHQEYDLRRDQPKKPTDRGSDGCESIGHFYTKHKGTMKKITEYQEISPDRKSWQVAGKEVQG